MKLYSASKSQKNVAKFRRFQTKDEFELLANMLPISKEEKSSLDRVHVLLLVNNLIRIRNYFDQILSDLNSGEGRRRDSKETPVSRYFQKNKLFGTITPFLIVINQDGQCVYASQNVIDVLGLSQSDLIGSSVFDFVHPCDVKLFTKLFGGVVPVENTGIFDWNLMQITESEFISRNSAYSIKPSNGCSISDTSECMNFQMCVRMCNTLTNRNKNVRVTSAIYRVVNILGRVLLFDKSSPQHIENKWIVGVVSPLMNNLILEAPIDRSVVVTKHSLDFKLKEAETFTYLGFYLAALINTSWYRILHPADYKIFESMHKDLMEYTQAMSSPYRVMIKAEIVLLRTRANVFYSSEGKPIFIFCFHDIIYCSPNHKKSIIDYPEKLSVICCDDGNNLRPSGCHIYKTLAGSSQPSGACSSDDHFNNEQQHHSISISSSFSGHSYDMSYASYSNLQKLSFRDLFSLYNNVEMKESLHDEQGINITDSFENFVPISSGLTAKFSYDNNTSPSCKDTQLECSTGQYKAYKKLGASDKSFFIGSDDSNEDGCQE